MTFLLNGSMILIKKEPSKPLPRQNLIELQQEIANIR
jgi:hypothetical protein